VRGFRGATRFFPAARRAGAAFLTVRAAVRFAAFLVVRRADCFDELLELFPRRCVFVFARQFFFFFFAMGHVRSSSRR
jgi:hypothetical protein